MSEDKTYTSSVKNHAVVASNDEVFSIATRDEALSILKKVGKHSIVGLVMQPIQNTVSGWLHVEFGPSVQDWDKTIKAREMYRSGVLDKISHNPAGNNASFEEPKKAA